MKKLLVLVLLVPVLGWAQSSFDGTWKIDLSKAQFPKKPDVLVLQNGTFQCKTCVPPIEVKADGQPQKVTGQPYFDTMSVKVVDDKHVEQASSKNGKEIYSEKNTLSDDGKTMSVDWVDNSAPSGKTITGKTTLLRVAAGPAGSHPISGSWRAEKLADIPDEGLLVTYKTEGDSFSMTTPTGQTYKAKFDGKDVPYVGDPGITTVSLKKLGANAFEETDKRDGKVITVAKISTSGNTLSIDVNDKLHETTSHFVASKQ
jgi:hypothetical protein